MKTHYELALAWSRQSKPHGRTGNLFFEGPVIYSYGHHYQAARLVEVKGQTVALVNAFRYSPSTQRHLSYIHSACLRHNPPIPTFDLDTDLWPSVIDGKLSLSAAVNKQAARNRAARRKEARAKLLRRRREVAENRKRITSLLLAAGIRRNQLPKFHSKREALHQLLFRNAVLGRLPEPIFSILPSLNSKQLSNIEELKRLFDLANNLHA